MEETKQKKENTQPGKSATTGTDDIAQGLLSLIRTNWALAAGAANAISTGYQALSDELSTGGRDITEPGFQNPILKGSLTGSLKAMDAWLDSLRVASKILLYPNLKSPRR
jgi:hypothetical protein